MEVDFSQAQLGPIPKKVGLIEYSLRQRELGVHGYSCLALVALTLRACLPGSQSANEPNRRPGRPFALPAAIHRSPLPHPRAPLPPNAASEPTRYPAIEANRRPIQTPRVPTCHSFPLPAQIQAASMQASTQVATNEPR